MVRAAKLGPQNLAFHSCTCYLPIARASNFWRPQNLCPGWSRSHNQITSLSQIGGVGPLPDSIPLTKGQVCKIFYDLGTLFGNFWWDFDETRNCEKMISPLALISQICLWEELMPLAGSKTAGFWEKLSTLAIFFLNFFSNFS